MDGWITPHGKLQAKTAGTRKVIERLQGLQRTYQGK